MIRLNDSGVVFHEDTHRYFLGDKELKGITSTLIAKVYPTTYSNVPQSVLDKAAEKGKILHSQIELHDILGDEPSDPRIMLYDQRKAEKGWMTVRGEYIVTDRKNYASPIDIVMCDKEGNIILADIKTTYDLHTDMVRLQLSIYKWLFELQNPHLKVAGLCAFWMPNRDHSICKVVMLEPVEDEFVGKLLAGEDVTQDENWIESLEREYMELSEKREQAEQRMNEIKNIILERMEKDGIKSARGNMATYTYVAPAQSRKFDSKSFKSDHQDLYDQYSKMTMTKASLRITTSINS